jgi:hypothetical protein
MKPQRAEREFSLADWPEGLRGPMHSGFNAS